MTRSANPRWFLSEPERQRVIAAIRAAEQQTSGEIRVHLERRCPGDATQRAIHWFEKLGMTATAQRNGVLLYLSPGARKFAVIGDSGIDARVPAGFWDATARLLEERFRADDFAGGLEAGIRDIGVRLGEHFPSTGTADRNELSDDISGNT